MKYPAPLIDPPAGHVMKTVHQDTSQSNICHHRSGESKNAMKNRPAVLPEGDIEISSLRSAIRGCSLHIASGNCNCEVPLPEGDMESTFAKLLVQQRSDTAENAENAENAEVGMPKPSLQPSLQAASHKGQYGVVRVGSWSRRRKIMRGGARPPVTGSGLGMLRELVGA
jgi:hypothetical protein